MADLHTPASLLWPRGGIPEDTTKLLPQLEAGQGHGLSLGREVSLRYPGTRALCSDVGDNNLSTRCYAFLFLWKHVYLISGGVRNNRKAWAWQRRPIR